MSESDQPWKLATLAVVLNVALTVFRLHRRAFSEEEVVACGFPRPPSRRNGVFGERKVETGRAAGAAARLCALRVRHGSLRNPRRRRQPQPRGHLPSSPGPSDAAVDASGEVEGKGSQVSASVNTRLASASEVTRAGAATVSAFELHHSLTSSNAHSRRTLLTPHDELSSNLQRSLLCAPQNSPRRISGRSTCRHNFLPD